ncbi:hypothetical protein HHK36_002024 [Tetracentron sinense]|uniref:Uncharacterized protein n=1 Tax=Tetracentron sinense TaxID=13715 RepID=A0A834ZYI6_TETSI|nr:hypothetical protein HHK36_002024 [Tetracentron sinense]
MERLLLLAFCYSLISLFLNISIAFDTIVANQSLRDGQTAQTLVSSGQRFELGFFSPGDSKDRYLGIWYKNMSLTVVWVANRNNPITDQSGVLTIRGDGNLVLLNQTEGVVWSSNSTRTTKNPVGQLLDSGNLVLKDETGNNSENYIWESFDYPSDTLLPTMKLGWNLKTGLHRYLTSWNNANDPSAGDFSFSLDPPESPQLVLRKGSQKQYRAGPWDGVRFSGTPELKTNPVFSPVFMSKPEEVYYTFEINDNSILSRFVVSQFGLLQYLTWSAHSREWVIMVTLQRDSCDTYGMCGAYGTCNVKDPNCKCLKGFTPKSPNEWNLVDWSSGCIRKSKLDCGTGEGFVKYTGLKLPDKSHVRGNKSMSRKECEAECLKDCSCMAYSKIDLNGDGSDCAVWFEDLIDIRQFTDSGDTKEELYIRMARSELGMFNGKSSLEISSFEPTWLVTQ